MRFKRVLMLRWMILLPLVCAFFGLAMGAAQAPEQRMPPGARQWMEAIRSGDREKVRDVLHALRTDYRMVDVSLAVREQVDFLLTPALLVQEAVSEDVVLTYPEE